MGVRSQDDSPSYMLDAASQIATLGTGFNSLPFFAPAFHRETYTNNPDSTHFKAMRKSFEVFLKRKLQWEHLGTTFCHSGAEANEIALGYCFRRRINKEANKVLAFEGSFHGRMQIALSSTWNKAKRAPFEWEEYETVFAPFPNTSSEHQSKSFDMNWLKNWEQANSRLFNPDLLPCESPDHFWKLEKESLLIVKSNLEAKNIRYYH